MNWLKRFKKSSGCVGIEFGNEHISLAVLAADGRSISEMKVIRDDSTKSSGWLSLLSEFVDKHQLQNKRCNVVLSSSDYQLLLVEAPDVPDEEMRQAVKWRIKDLIQTPVESAAIDVFNLPADASREGKKKMLYVVVSKLERIQSIIDLIEQAGLALGAIDIEVMALRNLTLLKTVERGAAVVRLRANSGDVSIYREGSLYLSRHFQLNYSAGLLDDIPVDALALEVQRSFDYFERQMGQVPPGVLYICGEGIGQEKITEELRRSLSVPIEVFDLMAEVGIDAENNDEGIVQLCLAAIGATFRQEAA